MVTKIGLDLGYANIALCDSSYSVYKEPSVALIDKTTRRILSVGSDAISPDAEHPDALLVRPFKNGLLHSAEFTAEIVRSIIPHLNRSDSTRCVFGLPQDMNSKQIGQIASIVNAAGVDECYFVNRALAALVGSGFAPTMSAISVNVGASTTEVAIMYRGRVIHSSSVDVGGEDFDEAVRSYILKNGELNISLLDARAIKESIGAVWEGREAEPITISGTLALTGNKIQMSICTEDILGVFEAPLHKLLSAVANPIRKIAGEYVDEIFENGIVLTGGGAELYGLDKMMRNVFGISTVTIKNPADCVVRGLSAICNFLPVKMRGNGKDITTDVVKYFQKANDDGSKKKK